MINIYGKGGHAKVVNSVLWNRHPKQVKFWNDDDYEKDTRGHWVIAIGNNNNRKKIANKLGKDCDYATIVADSASVHDSDIGQGSQILHRAIIQVGTYIGEHCIINTSASIDHDCRLDDFTFIGPNATLCGGVEIGECSFIGAGSVILPYVKIGKNCMIGAGSVVTKDMPDNVTAYGNPAKIK
mgnify:CR=1 FL=1